MNQKMCLRECLRWHNASMRARRWPPSRKCSACLSHTRAIPRHKGGALVEFDRQVILDQVEGGIVTRYQIISHPNEHGQAIKAGAHHYALFEHPPNLVAGDRGVHSADTEERLTAV